MSMESMYRLLYCIVWPFFNLCHPVRTIGRENLPEGGAVLCANHTAMSDPLFICFACTLRNKFRPMAKVELSKIPLIGWLLGKAGVIYVDRGHADVKAVKAALLCLKNHGNLLIFPEGTRVHEGEDVSAKGGAALFATRTGSPIVPVYVSRKKPWFRPTTVVIGQPFHPQIQGRKATADELDQITNEVMERIHALGEGAE